MHPEIARQLITQRIADLTAMARPRHPASRAMAPGRSRSRRLALPRASVPLWRITWSRVAALAGSERSWLIVISARRAHLGF
jgi:hypothetical protein